MSVKMKIQVLLKEIEKTETVLSRLEKFYRDYVRKIKTSSRDVEQAIVLSDTLVNYFTCLETIFLRISQFFENSLTKERWHADLLEKMTLQIEGVRQAVIQDETRSLLTELLKFRHFKRYYFDMNYDWDRIEFLQKKFDQLCPLVRRDLKEFTKFLHDLAES